MPVDDLWYRTNRGPVGERVPTKRHGQGKRWRVRFEDGQGQPRTRFFDRRADADAWDADVRSGGIPAMRTVQRDRSITFREYAERWRLSREIGWAVETRRRVESNLRCHLYPVFGELQVRSITLTAVLEWLTARLANDTPRSSLKLYFELLDTVSAAAVTDRIVPENPCAGVRLTQILRGLSRAPKWVPTVTDVRALLSATPARHRAAIWVGAGQGFRLGEALGLESTPRCIDPTNEELHVVQQLRYSPQAYGGFYLSTPKAGSVGTVDLDPAVAAVLAQHVRLYPPTLIELTDITSGEPVRRSVPLMFTTTHGNPFTDRTWSREWVGWRDAAGWPKAHGTFHALRHFFATTLITSHVEPQEVQRLLRHKTLRITLETYVHWWPRHDRPRGVVGALLQDLGG